jgi:hypothetical protein
VIVNNSSEINKKENNKNEIMRPIHLIQKIVDRVTLKTGEKKE